jgi:V/A-type H+/Na+-transporting ATPase subunit E
MTDQLQDLLQRVYDEGVSKAKTEAEQILEKANAEAAAIVAKAKAEAEAMLTAAQKQTADLKKNTDNDLKMAAENTMSAVKQKLADIFLQQAFDAKLHETTADSAFLQKLILEAVSAWKESGGRITISQSMESRLEAGFLNNLKDLAAKGMSVEFSSHMKNGFTLSPADGSYKLSFTDEDFANLFKAYLRPRTNHLLFAQ